MKYTIFVALVFTATVFALAFSAAHTFLSGVIMYDFNFDIMKFTLSNEQALSITTSAQTLTNNVFWPLAISNFIWIGLYAHFRFSQTPEKIKKEPNQSQ